MFDEFQTRIDELTDRQRQNAELLETIAEQQQETNQALQAVADVLENADASRPPSGNGSPAPEPLPEPEPEPEPETALQLGADDSVQEEQLRQSGVMFKPREPIGAIDCRLSVHTNGATHAYLKRPDGEMLQIRSIEDLSGGDRVTFVYDLDVGELYQVVIGTPGGAYNRGRAEVTFPLKNDYLEVVNGVYTEGGSQSDRYRYCFDRIVPMRQAAVDGGKPIYQSDLSELTRAGNARETTAPDGSGAVEIRYPRNSFAGINERTNLPKHVGHEPRVAHARYQTYFPDEFQWRKAGSNGGTKLPGFAHQNNCGYGGNVCRGQGFSARMFTPRPGGKHGKKCDGEVPLGLQVYDGTHDADKLPYGWHHMWNIGPDKGTWSTIDCRVTLGDAGEANDRIQGWVDGEKAFDYGNYLFFDDRHADRGIREWRWHYYFGGSWKSPVDNRIYVRDFELYADDDVPAM